jgi:hypothetical protein
MNNAIETTTRTQRNGRISARLARLGATVLTVAALFGAVAGPASAAGGAYRGASINRTSACHYTVTFTWESMGHGSNLTAWVQLVAWDGGNSSVIESHSFSPKTGRTGYVSYDFVSTESYPYRYQGFGYLQTSRGTVIAKSEVFSATIVPVSGESCAP